MSQIFDALKIEDTNKSFDKIIDQALAGNNWIDNPPPASEHYWTGNPSGLTPHKPMPSSSKIKNLGPNILLGMRNSNVSIPCLKRRHGWPRLKLNNAENPL